MKRFKVLSLAALVAFAACDEGSEPPLQPTPTGTITGVVTIEGQAASGVSVTLSSGASATTDGSGAYSFAGVNAGAYTVSISGFPTDATFASTARGATITAAGQVVTINFDGSYVRTAAIVGSVAAGGHNLLGVKVAISGANTAGASGLTDATGQYAFGGLRAGSYTVTISGWDPAQYSFASSSSTISVGAGEVKSVNFFGNLLATATITGTVTIGGAPVAGVKATLSTGVEATTDAAGGYTFPNLTAGSYTVTISGYPSDAVFESVAKSVTIPSAGSSVSANFAGTYVKTSTIVGKVSISGTGLAGVKVTLNTGASVNTDVNGDYAFAALRGGTYTVTISGWEATLHSFTTTSADVTVATGESAVQNFAGTYVATAGISGILFLDEGVKNLSYDGPTVEKTYALSGVKISIEGGAVATYDSTTTSDGVYSFTNLVPGTYRVKITPPANGTVGWAGGSQEAVVTLSPGGSVVVNWPFVILRQYVKVYSFLGKDATVVNPVGVPTGVRPQAGITIDLFDTYDHAVGNVLAGRIGRAVTDATGGVTFNYARSADNSPNDTPDNIVFARYVSSATANKTPNGEAVIEIKYNSQDSLVMAPDTFDVLNTGVILRFDAKEPSGTTLKGWATALFRNATDTLPAGTANQSGTTHATTGVGRFVEAYGLATLPDTFYIRLSDTQAGANNHNFTQTPQPDQGTAGGRFLKYVVDGTNPDSVWVGTQGILWTDQDVYIRAHNEKDDTVNYTNGDAVANSDNLDVQVYRVNADGTKTSVDGPYALGVGTGTMVFGINGGIPKRLPTGTYEVRSRSRLATQTVLGDTAITIVLDGSKQQDTLKAQMASATHPKGYSSYAWKYNNTIIAGAVRAADGTNANGTTVRIQTAANFVGPARDTTITITSGSYSKGGLLEGPYTVTASEADSVTVWNFLATLTGNTSATTASRETQGAGDDKIANFRATRMDTQVLGVVINDRDQDLSTIDPDEALAGVTVQLYRDGSGAITLDTLVATATTNGVGAFSFTGLREGRYITKATSVGNAQVLRGLSKDTAVVTTAATAVGSGANNTRVVGNTSPAVLPRWDYYNSVADGGYLPGNFTFLFTNTVVKGTVKTGGGVAVPGMTISLRRCNVSPTPPAAGAATSPPTGAGVCTTYLGTTVNMTSDATGAFQYDNLIEGVYEVRPQPTTVAGWTASTPAQILYITVGNADIEAFDFVIS